VDASKTLFVIADVRRMTVVLDVRQEDAPRVSVGQTVVFRPDGDEDAVSGKVAWVSTEADEQTRTVKVRAEIDNAAGRLRAHTFGKGRVVLRESPTATAVPTEAIHWEGCCHVVFVRLTDEVFQTRKVRIGAKDARFTEVLAGVLPGEVVATEGSHVLKSELLKSKLGAGCCDD
jgi:cobalt-zinc-cadmium efflux system membrane fusion protein